MGMMTGVSSPEERTRTFVLRQRVIPVPQSISTRFDGKDPSGTLLQQTAISTTTTTSSLSSSSSSENPTTTTAQLRVLGEMVVNEEKSFTIMLTVLVSFILIFFVICTYQVMRIWLCKVICRRDVRPVVAETNADGTDTMLVHEGRVFNLTGHQRRAVLEAIFSETSKVRTPFRSIQIKINKSNPSSIHPFILDTRDMVGLKMDEWMDLFVLLQMDVHKMTHVHCMLHRF